MKLTPEQRRIARTILHGPDDGLVALVRLAGLDPATALIGADLRGVVCAEDVTGFVFHRADLRGADFARARGKTAAMFEGATVDAGTCGVPASRMVSPPADFGMERVYAHFLRGWRVPLIRTPFVTSLNLSVANIKTVRKSIRLTASKSVDLRRRSLDIRSFTDLSALQHLSLRGMRVSNVAPLARLTALQILDLGGTRVTDLSPLAGLTALQTLDLTHTNVSDLSPLAGLTALQTLDLTHTNVSDLSPLAGLTALQTLDLTHTNVSDVAPLAGLTALQILVLWGTQVSDVAPLAGLTALQRLDLTHTNVSDVAPLVGLTALQSLNLWGTQVSDVAPLAGLTSLQSLNLWNTKVSDVSPLAGLTALQRPFSGTRR